MSVLQKAKCESSRSAADPLGSHCAAKNILLHRRNMKSTAAVRKHVESRTSLLKFGECAEVQVAIAAIGSPHAGTQRQAGAAVTGAARHANR
mmetsp:Transcript_56461/g.134835  ORF Transcript_56461/g.134835 Transcript_56461/m.134835 type:complete len:92 (-) Transcript_56461:157-432(-)